MKGNSPGKVLSAVLLLLFIGRILFSQDSSLRSVEVKVVLDVAMEKSNLWEKRIRLSVLKVFQEYEETFGIKLNIKKIEHWNPGGDTRSLYALFLNLQSQVSHGDCDIIIGFVFRTLDRSKQFGAASYLSGCMLLKALVGNFVLKKALNHELSHLFGAIDIHETGSIMNIGSPDIKFDEFTAKLIRLNKFRSFKPDFFPLSREKLDEAIALYKERLKNKQTEADVHTMLAILYLEKQDYESAISECHLALDQRVRLRLQVYNLLGIAFRKSGRIDEAIQEYKKIIDAWPNIPETHYNLGIAYMKKNMVDEAVKAYQKAIELNPNQAKIHSNLGFAYLKQGNVEEAIHACQRALEILPQFAEALSTLGAAYLVKEDYESAGEATVNALRLNEKLPGAHVNMGTLCLKKGRTEEAIQEYSRAIELNAQYPEAHYNLGRVYLLEDRVSEAVVEFEEAIRHNPRYSKAFNNLASCYLKMGLYENAMLACEKALKIQPDYTHAFTNLALVYLRMDRNNEAEEACRKALSLQADLPEVRILLGILHMKEERTDQAENELLKAVAIEPNHLDAHLNLGNLYFATKRFSDSESHYKKVLQLKPEYALVYNNLSVIYFRQSKYPLAWDYLKRAESLGFKVHPDFKSELLKKLRILKKKTQPGINSQVML